ncbi:nuclear transport factor 2 family protein [Sandaracinus amylolyticus]|uniref:Lumazine-binding protein n=1 Tax=Sandaracinus amylolyticus TaxID=927083 RepID=A0A0F6VZR0_9BACT|nr:nuclear transport factor 2 family protein [Sandaracinus amylolyticus]AKF03571.1 hypothetical protein DB32_000720 [Sandaracinus amylolyticus]
MDDHDTIRDLVETYFDGLFHGDTNRLRHTFHAGARLTGVVRGARSERGFDEYLAVVANRRSPESLGEARAMRITAVEIIGDVAVVRTRVAMLGFDYVDVLSLARHEGRWSIVHKLFTHVGS